MYLGNVALVALNWTGRRRCRSSPSRRSSWRWASRCAGQERNVL